MAHHVSSINKYVSSLNYIYRLERFMNPLIKNKIYASTY